MKHELDYIEKIAKILNDNNLTEIYLEDGDQTISVRKEGVYTSPAAVPPVASIPQTQAAVPAEDKPAETAPAQKSITSPMVILSTNEEISSM